MALDVRICSSFSLIGLVIEFNGCAFGPNDFLRKVLNVDLELLSVYVCDMLLPLIKAMFEVWGVIV